MGELVGGSRDGVIACILPGQISGRGMQGVQLVMRSIDRLDHHE